MEIGSGGKGIKAAEWRFFGREGPWISGLGRGSDAPGAEVVVHLEEVGEEGPEDCADQGAEDGIVAVVVVEPGEGAAGDRALDGGDDELASDGSR